MLIPLFRLYKEAYTGLSRNNWYLSLVMLINRSGTMVLPFMTIYCVQKLHFNITQAGTVMALFGCGAIAGAFAGGKITDRAGFHYVQIGALLGSGVLFILVGFLHSFVALCIGTFVLSMFNESFRPANSAAIAHYSSENDRTRSYSLNRLAINLGWSVGGALGGFLASKNYELLFWVDGCTNILAGLILVRLIPYDPATLPKKKDPEAVPVRPAFRDTKFVLFILLVLFYASGFFEMFTIQPVFFKTEWHLNERFIGFLMAINGLMITFIEMILVHWLEKKRPPLFYVATGVLLSGIAFGLFNCLPATAASAIMITILITLGEIFALPFMNTYWVSRSDSANRGEYAALYTIAWSAAQIISPLAGSLVVIHGGYALLWWLCAALCFIASAGFIAMMWHDKKSTA